MGNTKRVRRNRRVKEAFTIPDHVAEQPWKAKDKYPPKQHKYGAKPTVWNGIRFPSKLEARRYRQLLEMEDDGLIYGLTTSAGTKAREQRDNHLRFGIRWPESDIPICEYVADFRYFMPDGAEIIEDTKGKTTSIYRLKRKLLKAAHDIDIYEVFDKDVPQYTF